MKPEFDTPDGLARIQNEMARRLRDLDGLINVLQRSEKDHGRYLTMAFYESERQAREALPRVRAEWDSCAHMLAEPIESEAYSPDLLDAV